jgi:hypothetical protein
MTCKYTLTLTDKHLATIQEALNLYFRLGIGQVNDLKQHLEANTLRITTGTEACDVEDALYMLDKRLAGCGIMNATDQVKDACFIHDVIRHQLSWHDAIERGITDSYDNRVWPEMYQVWFDKPINYGTLPAIEINKVED